MGPHGRADHFRRQIQKFGIHVPQNRRRPFRQAGHFLQQPVILDQFQVSRETQGPGAFQNPRLALLDIQNDEMSSQGLAILIKVPGAEHLAAAHEPVSLAEVGGSQPFKADRNHLTVKHTEDALKRPDPAQPAMSPGHGFGPGETANGLFDKFGDDLRRWPAR